MSDKRFNIIRKENRHVQIFRRNLTERLARVELRHWKQQAINAGGHVFFELVEVPEGVLRAARQTAIDECNEHHYSRLEPFITDIATSPAELASFGGI